jgi:broad specificity phosphatase PhoE
MAQAVAKAYREAEWRAVYSSSLRRSIATAQPLCDVV